MLSFSWEFNHEIIYSELQNQQKSILKKTTLLSNDVCITNM